jgi:hypothetical protein
MNIGNCKWVKLKDENVLKLSHIAGGVMFGIYMILVYFWHITTLIQYYILFKLQRSMHNVTTMDSAIVGMSGSGVLKLVCDRSGNCCVLEVIITLAF